MQVAVVMDSWYPLVVTAQLSQPMTYERWLQWHFVVLLEQQAQAPLPA